MGDIQRYFALKMIIYKTQRKDFTAPDLARVLRRAKNAALPVKDKHFPPIDTLKKAQRAAFMGLRERQWVESASVGVKFSC